MNTTITATWPIENIEQYPKREEDEKGGEREKWTTKIEKRFDSGTGAAS